MAIRLQALGGCSQSGVQSGCFSSQLWVTQITQLDHVVIAGLSFTVTLLKKCQMVTYARHGAEPNTIDPAEVSVFVSNEATNIVFLVH